MFADISPVLSIQPQYKRVYKRLRAGSGRLVELCAGRNVRINHQQMELFFAVFVMHG